MISLVHFCFRRFGAAWLILLPGLLHAQLTFDPANPPTSANPPTELYNEYSGVYSHQKGPKTVLVFLVQPSDGAAWISPTSFATLDSQLNTASADYYNLYSYKQAWFGPKRRNGMDIPRLVVTPVLMLPGTTQSYKDGFALLQSDCLAALRALGGTWASSQVNDYNNFDRWVVMSNTKLISSTGLAYVGGRFAWTGGSLSGGVAEHEWGHNWGVYHANAWNVAAGAEPRSTSGSSEEYGDGWDLMGGNTVASGFNTFFRESLGFLERSRNEVVDVTTSGTYRLYDYIHPDRRQPAALTRALLIPMSNFTENKAIYLGFGHVATGSDARTVWNRNSVTVHTALGPSGSSRIDTTSGSRQTGDSDDSSIKIGRTWSEGPNVNGTQMYGGFHITPVARGADTVNGQTHEWIDVVVNYQNAILTNQPPVASFAQSQYPVATGSPLTFSVTASDPNGDALAYDWDFGDGTLSTSSAASQTKTWPAAGIYLVSCTVSDMKGGKATAATWVNVGTQTARAADTPAATFGGIDYEVFLGSWTTLPNFSQILRSSTGTINTIAIPSGVPANNFAVRYTGYFTVSTTDIYQFALTSEDGSRLKIGATTVITNDGQRSTALTQTGNAYLTAGTHAFTVEFFNRDNTPSINLQWRTATSALTTLTASDYRRIDWAANAAPVVSILNPEENTELVVGASVLLQATATDANGIAKVQYYAGGAYLGESSTAPYDVTWSNLSPGTKQVQAYAIDTTGRTTLSATRTFTVVSPPPRNLISLNFSGDSSATVAGAGVMNVDDIAGAVYQSAYWTTLRATASFGNPLTFQQMNGTTAALRDQTGTATSASITTVFTASNVLSNTSPANTGNSRLMRSCVWKRNTGDPGSITLNDLPYASYDVYVYFDALNTDANDIVPSAYTLNGVTKYGQNAASLVAGKGDFPNYATWTDYKEATATSASAPIAERLGNYVVFRNQSGPTFTLTVGASDPVNGIQIVEAGDSGAGVPAVRLLQSGGNTALEGGSTVAYLAWLAAAPDANVTLTLNPGAQLAANKASLTFTPANWQTPQVVLVTAVDDTAAEGAHTGTITHAVSATGNYASVTAPALTYNITDNDTATISVNVVQHAAEHASAPRFGLVRFTRNDLGSYAAPLTINFVATGTAGLTGDYTLSGASVAFNTGTGAGSVVIPAGQAQVVLTLTPTNDSTAEVQEIAIFTLQANALYTVGTPAAATVYITDDDAVDYLTEGFSNNIGNNLFDLNNLSITFTPSGGTYTAQTTSVTAFPSGTSGFTAYNEAAMPSGNADDGYWEQPLSTSFTYFGVTYNTLKVATNGYVFFASTNYNGNDLNGSAEAHFVVGSPRIAGLGLDLNPGTGGTVNYQRITTAGQQRHVFYYNAVRLYNGTNTVNFQIELFDDGRIRITHLASAPVNPSIVGLSSGVAGTMPSSPFETISSPRPFFPSDLSLLGTGAVSNVAPAFASLPVTSGTAGHAYSYTVVTTDANTDTLTLSAPTKPAWLTLSPSCNGTATLTGTPPAAGSYAVTLRANDGTVNTDQSFTLVAVPSGGNTAPVFTSTPVTLASSGAVYTYAVTATDADGHTLTLDAPVKPSWLTLTATGSGTATLTGTPPAGIPAPVITLSANDGITTTLQTYSLVVNTAPVVAITRPVEHVITLADLATELHLSGTASDDSQPTALTTTWSMVSGPGTAVFSTPSALETRVSFPVAGRYILRLTADDGAASISDEIQVYAGGDDPDAVRTTGLAGYWKFDEATGTTAADSSGNARNATLAGASSWNASGYAGAALTQTTPATSAFASYAYGSSHPNTLTVAAWIRLDEMPVNAVRYLFDTVSGTTQYFRIYLNTGSRKISVRSKRTTDGIWNGEDELPSNTWVHVAVSYDAGNVANDPVIYINGLSVPVTEIATPVGNATSQASGRIGVNWRGSIDEFRLYSRLVPASEIATLAVAGAFNAAPMVDAGADKDTAAGGTVMLDGSASDDGLPASPGALALAWSQDSGPSGGSFANGSSAATSFTSTGAGTYALRLTADDGSIVVSRSTNVSATAIASGYGAWKGSAFPSNASEADRGYSADFDHDGLLNLLEYALGTNPAAASTTPPGQVVNISGQDYLQIQWTRPSDRTDITTVGEVSPDLAPLSWSSGAGEVSITIVPAGAGMETVTLRDLSPLGTHSRRFLRARIVLNAP